MKKTKTIAFIAIMAALANLISLPPLAIPLQKRGHTSAMHFFQLAIFICGIIASRYAGVLSGPVGSLYMGISRTSFVIGGIAKVGFAVGLIAKKVCALSLFLRGCWLGWFKRHTS